MTARPSPLPTLHLPEAGVFSNHSHIRTVVSFTPGFQQPPTPDTPETAA